jgi:low affinity Fe/Cu permease
LTIEAAYSKNRQTQTVAIHSVLVEPLRARIRESKNEYVGISEKPGREPVNALVSMARLLLTFPGIHSPPAWG